MKKKTKAAGTTVSNNVFTGVHWDAQALDSVKEVALGLRANAEALSKLAGLFLAQNITIDSMLTVK